MRLFIYIAAIGLLNGAAAFAQSGGDPYTGKHLYRSFCAICHGFDGKTKGALAVKLEIDPPDLTSDYYQKKSVDEMSAIIGGYGREEESVMPKWTSALAESSIRHIAAYISKLKRTDLRLIGDTRRGRLIFKSACASCHGPRGKGNGVLAKLMNVKMINFAKSLASKRKSDETIMGIIRKGRGKFMPGWSGVLNDDEIIDVTAYIRSLQK